MTGRGSYIWRFDRIFRAELLYKAAGGISVHRLHRNVHEDENVRVFQLELCLEHVDSLLPETSCVQYLFHNVLIPPHIPNCHLEVVREGKQVHGVVINYQDSLFADILVNWRVPSHKIPTTSSAVC